jgi:hypothetical protein
MFLARLVRRALFAKVRRLHRRFLRRCTRTREVQQRTLLDKLRRHAESDFGREYGFAELRTVEAFRARLPVATYEDHAPWIDRVRRGEVSALFAPGTRVLMFALTSGTGSAPKTIPVTRRFLREYQLGWHVWGGAVLEDHPEAYAQRIFRIVSPWNESRTETGVPCGAVSGLMTESLPRVVRESYQPPLAVARVPDAETRYALAGRLGITSRISLVSSANPSSILAVARAVDENAEGVIRAVRQGDLASGFDVPDHVRRALKRHLRPDPARADELEAIRRRTGRLLPKDYWPDLALMGNWKGGACGLYLDRYGEYFGDVPVRDIGLLASEGRVTIPLGDEGSGGPLDIDSHFFEFIPEREIESDRPVTLLPHELDEGGRYFVVLTTSSGLTRYSILDLVEVTGFLGTNPEVRFISKGEHFSSLTGEKISEHQVVDGLRAARTDGDVAFADDCTLSPASADTPYYVLAVEPLAHGEDETWRAFLARFETALAARNIEYRAKRASKRLGAPMLALVAPGTFAGLRDRRLAEAGGRREQYKHRYLVSEIDFHRSLAVESTVTLDGD